AGGLQRLERGGRGPERERLVGRRRTAFGDGGLQVDHREVGGAQLLRDGPERGRRVVETRAQDALEVHVPAERENDRLLDGLLRLPRPTRRGDRRRERGGPFRVRVARTAARRRR